MNFSVLGSGRWGSFITWYLARGGHTVLEWGREESHDFQNLLLTRKNEYVEFSDEITLTTNLEQAVNHADIAVIAIKSQALREFATRAKKVGLDKKTVILCMKGLEEDSGLRLTEIMADCGYDKNKIAVWVGPGHIQEFVNGKPNCMVIDGYNAQLVKFLVDTLKGDLIRFYYGEDIIGNEIGAAAKNVMGIAAGILDGAGMASLKGPLMARGTREVARLINALGGNAISAYGLCHLGDYETTLFSPHSNNRRYGEYLVSGKKFEKLAEGVYTTKALKLLAEKHGVDMPITNAVYNILYLNKEPTNEILELFKRKTVTEFII